MGSLSGSIARFWRSFFGLLSEKSIMKAWKHCKRIWTPGWFITTQKGRIGAIATCAALRSLLSTKIKDWNLNFAFIWFENWNMNVNKLAFTMNPAVKQENFLPEGSVFCSDALVYRYYMKSPKPCQPRGYQCRKLCKQPSDFFIFRGEGSDNL